MSRHSVNDLLLFSAFLLFEGDSSFEVDSFSNNSFLSSINLVLYLSFFIESILVF